MQSFYGQQQGSMCNGKQAQTEKEEIFRKQWKEEQETQCSNQEKKKKFVKNKKRRKTENSFSTFKKCRFPMIKVKRTSPARQKAWKVQKFHPLVLNEKHAQITCLKSDSKNKLGKPIKNYLDLFINTSLNHVSITSRLVSQPNKKLKLNIE